MIEAIFGVPIATALGLANLGVGTANLIATGSNRKELKALANHSKAEHQKIYNICERLDMGIAAQSKLLQNQTDLLKAQSDNVLALNQRLYSTSPQPNQYMQQYYQNQQALANQANVYNQAYNPTQPVSHYSRHNSCNTASNYLVNYCQQQAQNARIEMLANEVCNFAANPNKSSMQPGYPMFQQPTIPAASPTFTDDQLQTLMKYITG